MFHSRFQAPQAEKPFVGGPRVDRYGDGYSGGGAMAVAPRPPTGLTRIRGDLVIFRCQLWPQGPPHRERYLLSDFERAHDELLAPYWSLDWLRNRGRPLDMVWSCSVSRLAGEHKMRGVMYLRPGGDSCWHSRDTPETCTHLQYMSLSRSGTHPLPLRVCTGT